MQMTESRSPDSFILAVIPSSCCAFTRMSLLAPSGAVEWLGNPHRPEFRLLSVSWVPCMRLSSPRERVQQALEAPEPAEGLLELARELRDVGMAQSELFALYDSFRERHAPDADETIYNAILDTMDFIAGWCRLSQNIYPKSDQAC